MSLVARAFEVARRSRIVRNAGWTLVGEVINLAGQLTMFLLVISPTTPKWIQAGYGLWMVFATMGWFSLVSVFFTREDVRAGFLRHGHWIDRALGVVFLGFAASLVFASL